MLSLIDRQAGKVRELERCWGPHPPTTPTRNVETHEPTKPSNIVNLRQIRCFLLLDWPLPLLPWLAWLAGLAGLATC